jgi:uncharacterized protein YjiS (DUF1127 family)
LIQIKGAPAGRAHAAWDKEAAMTSWTANPWTAVSTGFAAWWRNMRAARASLGELEECGKEATHIAHDLGLAPSELRNIAAKGPDAAHQLEMRLDALHLDPAALRRDEPLVMRDLERVCSVCGSKRRCKRDLARFPDDGVWRKYCPNATTLDALEAGSVEKEAPYDFAGSMPGAAG